MKKLAIMSLILFALITLASCNGNSTEEPTATQSGDILPIVIYEEPPTHSGDFTIEELGKTIIAAGTFWEDWWSMRGFFSWENLYQTECGELPAHYETNSPEHLARLERQEARRLDSLARIPEHLQDLVLGEFLPTAALSSLEDVVNYLLSYHTVDLLTQWLANTAQNMDNPFHEYNGVLFVDVTRAGFPRADWDASSHVIFYEGDGYVVVESRVLWGSWHRICCGFVYPWEVIYRFTMVDGLIDGIEIPYGIFDGHHIERTIPTSAGELAAILASANCFWLCLWQWRHEFQGNLYEAQHQWWFVQRLARGVTDSLYHGGYGWILPESGFESLEDIRIRLLQNFTDEWVEQILLSPLFLEYDTLLHVHLPSLREFEAPQLGNIHDAIFTIIERNENDSRIIMDVTFPTVVLGETANDVQMRVVFINGRIDSIDGWSWTTL